MNRFFVVLAFFSLNCFPLFSSWATECQLALAGDVMLGRYISDKSQKSQILWGDTLKPLQSAHLTLINHEFVLTNSKIKEDKTYNFRASPSQIKHLEAAGVDFASLGNNHSLDYGVTGLNDTIKILSRAGIAFAGAGLNFAEASKPQILQCGPYKIGVLSFTNNMPEWAAGSQKPGVFYLPIQTTSLNTILPMVKALKSKSDFVIISAHWGRNWDESPPEGFQEFAHAVMDAGADIWQGHSGHIIQGIEIYKGKPIFYSMGDLIDDYKVEPARNDLAYLAQVNLDQKQITSITLLPTAIKNFRASLATKNDFDWVALTLQKKSVHFNTSVTKKGPVLFVSPAH